MYWINVNVLKIFTENNLKKRGEDDANDDANDDDDDNHKDNDNDNNNDDNDNDNDDDDNGDDDDDNDDDNDAFCKKKGLTCMTNIIRKPIEECVTDKFGEEEAQRILDNSLK